MKSGILVATACGFRGGEVGVLGDLINELQLHGALLGFGFILYMI